MAITNSSFDIVPTHLAVMAMRDSGYKNAAYALAELVDNAIQATASQVEIICKEEEVKRTQRNRKFVKEIAIIDNGLGMSEKTLRTALQFGNGERLTDRSGIGRFGMGLPNSSISQAKRVEVWTWQDGYKNAIYSYLDLSEIQTGSLKEIPTPERKKIPLEWVAVSKTIANSQSGTLVVWKDLDKCEWKTAHAIFRNSEFTVGRIYRKYIVNEKASIRMASFLEGTNKIEEDQFVLPNDPLYLMAGTSTPGEWSKEPMFEAFGEPHIEKWDGQEVRIYLSIAKKSAREGFNPGGTPYGKHASNNIGISIMRADRELELQTSGWVISYNPVERFWGAEIDFPPALDEIFGVTNNKQSARALADIAAIDLDTLAIQEGFSNQHELVEAWTEEKNPRLLLIKIKQYIESNLSTIRRTLKSQTEQTKRKRHPDAPVDPDSAEKIGTDATKRRIEEEGISGGSDKDENKPEDEKIEDIEKTLEQDGFSPEDATQLAEKVISDGRKYEFYEVDLPTSEFFTVRPRGGVILIGLNTNHPAYDHLVTLLRDADEENDIDQLKQRMKKSFEALKLLLEAWARYEDELSDGTPKSRAQDARMAWGVVAREFFKEE
jgi:hypothetical protein